MPSSFKNKVFHKKHTFIVAEISSNHGRSFSRAVNLIRKAKECGADAVKFQVYTPDTLTIDSNKRYFKIRHHRWKGQTLYQLYKKTFIPWDWFKKLKNISDDLGILFFATVFDKTAVDLMEELNVSLYKISSFEIVDLSLIEYVAKTKKQIILSTGMATACEVREALKIAQIKGGEGIVLLKCTSSYPAKLEDINLLTIPDMIRKFNVRVGFSDHTLCNEVSLAAVALGASVIEKHFTLSRKIKTPDNFFSIEPSELKKLAEGVRNIDTALGKVNYGMTPGEKNSCVFRRSLFVVKDIKKGEKFTNENIRSIRPDYGLKPKYLKYVLKKKAKITLHKGIPLLRSFISG